MDKRGKPNGGPNVDEVTRDFAGMGVDDVGGMKFNEKTSLFKGDFCLPEPKEPIVLNSGGAGASKTSCKTPGSFGDRRMKASKKTLQNTGKGWQQRVVNQGGVGTPSTTRYEQNNPNTGPRRTRPSGHSLRGSQKYFEDDEFRMATDSCKGDSPSTGKLLGSERSQVVDELEAGRNSDDVNEVARRMAADKRDSRRLRKLLGSELGQPRVW